MKYNVKSFSKLFMTATAMKLNTKADFHPCQESVTEKAKITELPDDVSAGIADGASMVHCIVPDTESNYKEYSEKFSQQGEIK